MGEAGARRAAHEGAFLSQLHDRIGTFLNEQRLAAEPANYTFAWHLFSHPEGPLARAVASLTDGGVRLTQRDIESLDTEVRPAATSVAKAEGLVATAELQIDGFSDVVRAMHAEARDFGRNLAQSAEAIERSRTDEGHRILDELARLTAAMITRVQIAEAKLERARLDAGELREKLAEARESARRDPLTGLANRRALEEAHAAQLRTGRPSCVAICDIDYFKAVNDRFGHAVGDRVLKAIGEVISDSCPGHVVARYGGEEFAILFRNVDKATARTILDNARANVAAKRYRLRENDDSVGKITFSSGLTAGEPDEMLATALHRADALLYKAKEAGRNCVCES